KPESQENRHNSTKRFENHTQNYSKATDSTYRYNDHNSTFSSIDISHNEQWLQHLFDVLAEDEVDHYSNFLYYKGETCDSKDIDGMSEEDYAAFIRKAEQQAEQQRLMRHYQAEQIRLQEIRHERRISYLAHWNQFDINGQSSVVFKDIPWPTTDIRRLSKVDVEDFLLSGIKDDSEIRSILRQEQIRFHPDRWHRWIKRMPSERQKKKIMETVTEIS
ncbi:10813_t:CDS:2, partial [Racocetra fulgida]